MSNALRVAGAAERVPELQGMMIRSGIFVVK
jgi:hypothetical protein